MEITAPWSLAILSRPDGIRGQQGALARKSCLRNSTFLLTHKQQLSPWDVTCPASTPFTTIYITTYETIRPTTVTTTYDVTEMITRTVPTTATIARSCPSWYTEVGTPAPWQSCTFNTLTCITLACLEIRTRTAVCQTITDPCCTRTVTDTLYADCPTACPTGCGGTSYTTITLPCPTTA